jgi:septal ring factor EnvC (AmiA/AmiB activator)
VSATHSIARAVVTLTLLLTFPSLGVAAVSEAGRRERLEAIRGEIARLRDELEGLERRERSVIGEIERLGAEIRLRVAEVREIEIRIEAISEEIDRRDESIRRLAGEQERRREYLAFRLREIYKRGPVHEARRLLGGDDLDRYLPGLRYATYLSERDARVLREYRDDRERLEVGRAELAVERSRLEAVQTEAVRAREALGRSRDAHERSLRRLREDRRVREDAVEELRGAADSLSRLVARLGDAPEGGDPVVDILKFRGLLDWPALGEVGAVFGNVVHPRFKTVVPHPGWDIEAPDGSPFRAVFDGTVLYAAWLHGYGLTVIVDHGHGVVSIYAHASVITVEKGESIVRGDSMGRVGDTGSLRGPYLYFEIRENGKPVDPAIWLRNR